MRITTIVLFLILAITSFAQKKKWQPINDIPDLGWFAEAGVSSMFIAEDNALLGRVRGAVTYNNNNAIGVNFSWSLNRLDPPNEVDNEVFLNAALTSAFYEYVLKPYKKLHVSFSADVGAGDVNMEYKNQSTPRALFPYEEKYFFFAQPSVRLELNVLPKIRANVAASYVWVPSLEDRAVNAANFSGPAFSFGIKYGKFL